MVDKLMYIPKYVAQNYTFGRLQLIVETFGRLTNQNSIFLKVIKPTNKNTLGSSVINRPMSSNSPACIKCTVFLGKITLVREKTLITVWTQV